MSKITLVVLCAGNSSRFKHKTKKQWLRIEDEPLWLNVTRRLSSYKNFKKVLVVSHKEELNYMKNFTNKYEFVQGGETRQESIKNALEKVTSPYVMITDVARAGVPKKIIKNLIKNKNKADCIVPILDISDTVVYKTDTINRDEVKLIQTPQLSKTKILKQAIKSDIEFTDDSSAIKSINGSIFYIKGSTKSKKLTFGNELKDIACIKQPSKNTFTGIGLDIHQFEDDKKMYLGGVEIPCDYGFKAHSDGDVAIHSIIDALLGACGAGDIGEFFPDTDEKYKGADSTKLLEYIVEFIYNVGYEIVNIDLTILAQQPKINPHKDKIKSHLSKILGIEQQFINIKATTGEKMGFIGRAEGIAVQSIATLKYYDWKKQ